MAKIILEADLSNHHSILKSYGYDKVSDQEYKHKTSGHSFLVKSNGSWSHFGADDKLKHSVSNADTGSLIKDYLKKIHTIDHKG